MQRDSKRWTAFRTSVFLERYVVREWSTSHLKCEVLHIPSTTARALVYTTAVQQRQLRAKWLLCSTTFFEMGMPHIPSTTARALVYSTTVQQRQLRAKWLLWSTRLFAFVSSTKHSRQPTCSARFVFVSTFNLQRGRAFVVGITNLSKYAVCVKAKVPADRVYQRRTWDEFKRVLSVAHASQPAERAENLEYRKQLSGVCWGAVYCSIESIFLNHPVLHTTVPLLVLYRRVSCSLTTTQEQGWEQNVRWNVLVR